MMHFASAQTDRCTLSISGKVVDEKGEALAGATVVVDDGSTGAVADAQGRFVIASLCEGRYKLTVHFVGYNQAVATVSLRSNLHRDFRLQQEPEKLDEVVIHDESLKIDAAQNYSKLSEKQLEVSAGKTLGETLKEIPGVNTIQTGPGIFKPVIHGLHSQRILILNYGIRQEGQQWGAEHAPEIDPMMASDIIVVKDASAIKYGTDALGGVIIVNPPPLPEEAKLGGSLNTIVQSNGRSGTVSGMVEGGVRNHQGWGWRVQGTAKRTGDFKTPRYYLTNTGIKEFDFSAATGYHGKRFSSEIFFSRFQTQLGILKGTSIGSLDDLVNAMEREPPQGTTGFSYHIGHPSQEVQHNLIKINSKIVTEKGYWNFQYGFQNDRRKEFDVRMGSYANIPALDLRLNSHTVDVGWQSDNVRKTFLSAGVNGMIQQNTNVPGTLRIPFIPNFNTYSAGAYGIVKIPMQRWRIDLGARYDFRFYDVNGFDFKNTLYHADLSFKNPSLTAGALWQINAKETFTMNISSAWRPPHVAELYSLGTHQSAAAIEYGLLLNDTTNEVMSIGAVPFKTEHALKWVNSYRYQTDRLQFEATAYMNYIFNYIYLKPTGVTQNIRGVYPYFRYTQTNALFTGVDLSAQYKINKHFTASPSVALLRASDVTHHDYLIFIPSNRYSLSWRYQLAQASGLREFYIEARLRYVERQHRAPRVVTVSQIVQAQEQGTDLFQNNHRNFDFMAAPPGYFLGGLSTGFSIPTSAGRYDFRLSADNLFNKVYREYTNRFRYYANDLGRNIILSVKYIF
jgi:iron complex outermembrane receptor protein